MSRRKNRRHLYVFALVAVGGLVALGIVPVLGPDSRLGDPVFAAQREEPPYPHGDYREECSMCHWPNAWKPAVISKGFDHAGSGFALDGAHSTVACRACHASLEFEDAEAPCVSCHLDVHGGELGVDCAQCHSTRNFVDRADDVRSHRITRFPLTGAHATVDCASCHPTGPQGGLRFVNTPIDCVECHSDDFQRVKEPDHVALGFDRDCTSCHTVVTWSQGRVGLTGGFDHSTTGFPLVGAHRAVDCAGCHAGNVFVGTPSDCLSCHQQDYQGTTQPGHAAQGFPTNCVQCHSENGWTPARFDHDLTGFSLTGAHNGLACESCHAGDQFTTQDSACSSCHQSDYDGAPNHAASNFSLNCEECHGTVTWTDAAINHDFFPLVGGHSGVSCEQCHTGGVYGTIPADCLSCHQSDYDIAPGHVGGGFPQTCEDCHSVATWLDATFDHGFFPLSAGHAGLECVQCHTTGTYTTIPPDCVACHQNDYDTAPGHVSGSFPQTCEQCHNSSTWLDANFAHDFFPLSAGHAGLECAQCHTTGTYATIPADCVACHQNDYNAAPGHVSSSFPQTCEQCHGSATWLNATFDHSFFPLTSGHAGLLCQQCHASGSYDPIPADCVFCHQADYVNAPSHVASNLPQTCEQCHSTATWLDADFAHDFFPLSGGHAGLVCAQCHTTGVFGTIPADCFSCHQSDYQAAPGHVSSNFPHECETCHGNATWLGASFDHQFFPLTGGHNGLDCVSCHANGTYNSLTSDCYACHQADYPQGPDHVTLNLSFECESCHTVSGWRNLVFVHPWPLVGPHRSPSEQDCSGCHISNTTANFSCEGACHKHTQPRMLDKHSDVSGYEWDFPTCVACHANGRG